MANYIGNNDLSNYPFDESDFAEIKLVDGQEVELTDEEFTQQIDRAIEIHDAPPEPPSSDELYAKINEYFIDKEGSTDAGLDRVDSLLGSYPSADRAIANGTYDLFKNRVNKAESDNELTSTEAQKLIDFTEGKT